MDTCRTGRKVVVLFNWREYERSSKSTLINFAGFISMQWVFKILPYESSAGKLGGSVVMFTFHNWNIDWIQMLAVPTGIIAMLLGSYGSHMYQPIDTYYKEVWNTAALYHMVHSAALLAVPITKRPHVVRSLNLAHVSFLSCLKKPWNPSWAHSFWWMCSSDSCWHLALSSFLGRKFQLSRWSSTFVSSTFSNFLWGTDGWG
jgi:hypothetical protein